MNFSIFDLMDLKSDVNCLWNNLSKLCSKHNLLCFSVSLLCGLGIWQTLDIHKLKERCFRNENELEDLRSKLAFLIDDSQNDGTR